MPRKSSLQDSASVTILNSKEHVMCDNRARSLSWPEQHKPTIAALDAISNVTWAGYETAEHLASERQNEQGWRLNLEHHIVERFRFNIECKCKKRVWVCDFELPLDHFNENCTQRIQRRRDIREICTCSRNEIFHNEFRGSGTPTLFVDVAGEGVLHDSISELRKLKQPDRIFGLRRTSQLRELLLPFNPTEYSALKKEGLSLVFPFFMLESKSEEGQGSSKTYEQSALPLQSFLELQNKLQAKIGVPKEKNKSLVWFLAHRGRDWQIFVAYTRYEGDTVEIVLVRVWEGNLTSKDKALQLLLAIDFIYDWARDVYRENIISWLRMTRPKTTRVTEGGDIVSPSSTLLSDYQDKSSKLETRTDGVSSDGPLRKALSISCPSKTSSNSNSPSKPSFETSSPKGLFGSISKLSSSTNGSGGFGHTMNLSSGTEHIYKDTPVDHLKRSKSSSNIDPSSKPRASFAIPPAEPSFKSESDPSEPAYNSDNDPAETPYNSDSEYSETSSNCHSESSGAESTKVESTEYQTIIYI